MVQTGMTTPFGAATPTGFPAQNGDVKPADDKPAVPLLPPPAGAATAGAGPPFSPPPPQPPASAEPPAVSIACSPATISQNQPTYKCDQIPQVRLDSIIAILEVYIPQLGFNIRYIFQPT